MKEFKDNLLALKILFTSTIRHIQKEASIAACSALKSIEEKHSPLFCQQKTSKQTGGIQRMET